MCLRKHFQFQGWRKDSGDFHYCLKPAISGFNSFRRLHSSCQVWGEICQNAFEALLTFHQPSAFQTPAENGVSTRVCPSPTPASGSASQTCPAEHKNVGPSRWGGEGSPLASSAAHPRARGGSLAAPATVGTWAPASIEHSCSVAIFLRFLRPPLANSQNPALGSGVIYSRDFTAGRS